MWKWNHTVCSHHFAFFSQCYTSRIYSCRCVKLYVYISSFTCWVIIWPQHNLVIHSLVIRDCIVSHFLLLRRMLLWTFCTHLPLSIICALIFMCFYSLSILKPTGMYSFFMVTIYLDLHAFSIAFKVFFNFLISDWDNFLFSRKALFIFFIWVCWQWILSVF